MNGSIHDLIASDRLHDRIKAALDAARSAGTSSSSELAEAAIAVLGPTPMLLWCPSCHTRHVDLGEFATKPHHTHACQGCGMVWRPAIVATVGVQFLPGFKD